MVIQLKITDRVQNLEYAIRDVVGHARKLEKQGRDIIYLNIGDPLLFDFDTPENVKAALIQAVKEGFNRYSPSEGIPELRTAICEKEKRIGGIDVLLNNAGVLGSGAGQSIGQLDPNEFHRVMAVNGLGPLQVA